VCGCVLSWCGSLHDRRPPRLLPLPLKRKTKLAHTAAQKANDRVAVGKAKKKHRNSATRGLTLSGKVDARFLKGDARSATQKKGTARSNRTRTGRKEDAGGV
jgi:hypothetical protein